MTQGQNSPRGKVVSINGMEMYYESYGGGDPLVLLHGFYRSSQIWEPFIHEFSKRFRLILPDLQNRPASSSVSRIPIQPRRNAGRNCDGFTSTGTINSELSPST